LIPLAGLAVSYLPAIAWLAVFLSQDRYDPQPRRLIAVLFLLGIGATVPAGWVNDFLVTIGNDSAATTIGLGGLALAALSEETIKAAFALVGARGQPTIREPVDGMIALMTVALGFAAGETTGYVVSEYRQVLAQAGGTEAAAISAFFDLAVRRGLITTLGHACWSGIAGYAFASFVVGGRRRALGALGLLGAAGLHWAFNASSMDALSPGIGPASAMVAWVAAVALAVLLFTRALSASPFRRQQLRARLMGMPLFADIPPDRLAAASERLELVTARAGDVLIAEGEPADSFYIVDAGFVVAMQGAIGPKTHVLRRMGPGEVFGQLGLLLGTPRTASVVAETDATLLTLDRDAFLEMVGGDPIVRARLVDIHRSDAAAAVIGGSLLAHVRQASAPR
jgi:RsiW-degrading membrane proteinase PrsW (M82 family)